MNEPIKKVYQGQLRIDTDSEYDYALFLSTDDSPLVEVLEWMHRKTVSIRYWITDKQCSLDDAIESAVLQVMGMVDADYDAKYSDYTGYLWTDEDLKIGGHDLLAELKSNVGKWLILEVITHD